MGTELLPSTDLSSALALADVIDRRLPELAGDQTSLATGMAHLAQLIDALKIVQRTAGKMLCDTLPLTSHGNPIPKLLLEDLGIWIERVTEGGVWTDIDGKRAVRDIIVAAIKDNEGEVNPNQIATAILECVGISYLKEDEKKATGLARFGLTRSTYATKRDATYTAKVKV